MVLVQLCSENPLLSDQIYFQNVVVLEDWCKLSALHINVKKTEEVIFSCNSGKHHVLKELKLHEQAVEIVESFKYLGTYLDTSFTFGETVDNILKKASQRLFLMRKLKSFDVSQSVLEMVYKSHVESILQFNITAWYGNLGVRSKNKLQRIVRIAEKIIGQQMQLEELYLATYRKASSVVSDFTHPLLSEFVMLPSGRRYKVPKYLWMVYNHSFVPVAVIMLSER